LSVESAGGFRGGAEAPDEVVEGGEVGGEAGLAGGDGETDGEHGFADSGWSEEGDVGSGLDEVQGGQVVDLAGGI
jgi:hypothetical protein